MRFKMVVELLLMNAVLIGRQALAQSDPGIDHLHEIIIKLEELTGNFAEKAQEVFYDTKRVAEAEENYSLLAIAAEMAEFDALWFAAQRQGLLHAETIIIRHFLAPLEKPIKENEADLIDMIVKRAQERSMMDPKSTSIIERARKKIYLYVRRYDHIPGAKELMSKYAKHIVSMQTKQMLARRELQESVNRYRKLCNSTMGIDEFALASLISIDALLDEPWDGKSGRDFEDLLLEILHIREQFHEFEQVDNLEIDLVPLSVVSEYEQRMLGEPKGISSYLDDLDTRIVDLDRKFHAAMQKVFYDQIDLGEKESNAALLALSCQVAELEALAYVEQRRMLQEIKRLIAQHSEHFKWLFEINKNLVDFIVQHLIAHSIVGALIRVEKRRKKLYISLNRYQLRDHVRDLARLYFLRIHYLKNRQSEFSLILEMYKNQLLSTLTPEQLSQIIQVADELVQRGIEMWFSKLHDRPLLKMQLKPDLYKDIWLASWKWFNKIHRPTSERINELSSDQINQYERDMLVKFHLDNHP